MVKHPSRVEVLDVLQEIAPLELAAEWDNVGLLLDPPSRAAAASVARVLLTIDLSVAVVDEARRLRADLVVAYHPPIWKPWRRLVATDPQQAAALAAFAAGIAVYTPHTALDAAPGGIADWLCEGLCGGKAPASLEPCGDGEFGRVLELRQATTLRALLPRIKRLLGVRTLRVAHTARGSNQRIRRIAVAAGSGGSVLKGQAADLWLTGELSHHDALAAVAAGTAVVLGEHSNTERGYLKLLQKRLREPFGKALDVRVAASDRDPFAIG